jgi:hypothetical protein
MIDRYFHIDEFTIEKERKYCIVLNNFISYSTIMALRPSGFGEYSPAEQREFDRLINCIQQNYQQF